MDICTFLNPLVWRRFAQRLQVKKWNVTNTVSNFTSIITYNETGAVDYTDLFAEIADAFGTTLQDAGHILTENLEDTSFRAGLSQAGWKPKRNMTKQAVEWWQLGAYFRLSSNSSAVEE